MFGIIKELFHEKRKSFILVIVSQIIVFVFSYIKLLKTALGGH